MEAVGKQPAGAVLPAHKGRDCATCRGKAELVPSHVCHELDARGRELIMLRRAKAVWEYLAHRQPFEDELDEEIRSQFELLVDRLRAGGTSEAAARRAARIEFG